MITFLLQKQYVYREYQTISLSQRQLRFLKQAFQSSHTHWPVPLTSLFRVTVLQVNPAWSLDDSQSPLRPAFMSRCRCRSVRWLKVKAKVAQSCLTLRPWNSSGQSTGVGSRSLLQGIFPIQGQNPGLPHCRWILYQLSHKGSPRILEWVAWAFSRGSSRPRNGTGVSCIAGGFFTN